MNPAKKIFSLLLLSLWTLGSWAEGASDLRLQLSPRLDALLQDSLFVYSNVGIMVYDLDADVPLYEHHAQQMLRPASTMKLLTAIAALDSLGADYCFSTKVFIDGEISGRTLHGRIYCEGGWDPTLDESDLDEVVDALCALGIDTITGGVIDNLDTEKDIHLWGEGWCWDDENPLVVPLRMGKESGRMVNFGIFLCNALRDYGVTFLHDYSLYIQPVAPRLVATISTPLPHVLQQMMKNSDNLYAESLFYRLSNAKTNLQRVADAKNTLLHVITKAGADPERCRLADGSGLSLYNYLSPSLEVQLLRYAYHDRNIFAALLPALPVSGIDGTLRSRMTDCPGRVFAKTGTVTGVSALAGYTEAPNGHLLAFSIINQGCLDRSAARRFQDDVCRVLCGAK